MGNCISKTNKEYFLAFEKEIKNEILFSKGKTRCVLEMCGRGKKIYMRPFHKEVFKNVASVSNWDVVEKSLK